jgi:hypothetical protein
MTGVHIDVSSGNLVVGVGNRVGEEVPNRQPLHGVGKVGARVTEAKHRAFERDGLDARVERGTTDAHVHGSSSHGR